ncbi:MAG: hypothetical protein LW875_05245 [Proteobacteria bacterium]|jgi:hypothetical protein|nr:hypothetical protein [Pseudomonadota bacterium]
MKLLALALLFPVQVLASKGMTFRDQVLFDHRNSKNLGEFVTKLSSGASGPERALLLKILELRPDLAQSPLPKIEVEKSEISLRSGKNSLRLGDVSSAEGTVVFNGRKQFFPFWLGPRETLRSINKLASSPKVSSIFMKSAVAAGKDWSQEIVSVGLGISAVYFAKKMEDYEKSEGLHQVIDRGGRKECLSKIQDIYSIVKADGLPLERISCSGKSMYYQMREQQGARVSLKVSSKKFEVLQQMERASSQSFVYELKTVDSMQRAGYGEDPVFLTSSPYQRDLAGGEFQRVNGSHDAEAQEKVLQYSGLISDPELRKVCESCASEVRDQALGTSSDRKKGGRK